MDRHVASKTEEIKELVLTSELVVNGEGSGSERAVTAGLQHTR